MKNAVQDLILCQDRLYSYILALLGDPASAEDVLQETNLAATGQLQETANIDDFTGWVFGVARHQVQAFRRRQARERIRFNDELIDLLADEVPTAIIELNVRQQALRGCLADLPSEQRELILRRYAPGASVQGIAAELKRTVGVVSQTLYRIRVLLLQCIRGKLAAEGAE